GVGERSQLSVSHSRLVLDPLQWGVDDNAIAALATLLTEHPGEQQCLHVDKRQPDPDRTFMGPFQDGSCNFGVVESAVGRRSDWDNVRSSHWTGWYRHRGDGRGYGSRGWSRYRCGDVLRSWCGRRGWGWDRDRCS